MTEEEFRNMCMRHDLTYQYSDDHGVWTRENTSLAKIETAAKQLPREVAVRIWNEVVDTKIVEDGRSQFYWKA